MAWGRSLILVLTRGLRVWYTSPCKKLCPDLWPGLFFCSAGILPAFFVSRRAVPSACPQGIPIYLSLEAAFFLRALRALASVFSVLSLVFFFLC